MTYCNRCVMPSSKPDLFVDEEGVCAACRNFDERKEIPWEERDEIFRDHLRGVTAHPYHCIVPVSGGKDSTAQILKILELGYNPLAVNARTCDLSGIGRRNLDNIRRLGVDLVEVAPNAKVRGELNKFCLETVGDISWPEHVSIFTTPVAVAIQRQIPLIIWGENPQHEYGGPRAGHHLLDRGWLEEFGGLLGLRVTDLGLLKREVAPYTYPDDVSGIEGLFMGYFYPWDGLRNAVKAKRHGFEWWFKPVEAHGFRYENLDNHQTGIHDFFKYIKFGFGRATDIACTHVRRGRWTRDEALTHVRIWDGKYPSAYLGKTLDHILSDIRMHEKEFLEVCEMFINRDLFEGDPRHLVAKKSHSDTAA
jgi:N-acetyl sugar amidotransferase